MIHEGAFFGYFFQIFSPDGAASPFQTERAHTQKNGLIFIYIDSSRSASSILFQMDQLPIFF